MIGAMCIINIGDVTHEGIVVGVRGKQLGLNIPTILPLEPYQSFGASEYSADTVEWTTVADHLVDNKITESTFVYCYRKADWAAINLFCNPTEDGRLSILEVDRTRMESDKPKTKEGRTYNHVTQDDLDDYVLIGYCSANPQVYKESELRRELEDNA